MGGQTPVRGVAFASRFRDFTTCSVACPPGRTSLSLSLSHPTRYGPRPAFDATAHHQRARSRPGGSSPLRYTPASPPLLQPCIQQAWRTTLGGASVGERYILGTYGTVVSQRPGGPPSCVWSIPPPTHRFSPSPLPSFSATHTRTLGPGG